MATTDLTGGALAVRPALAETRKFIIKSGVITVPAGAVTNDVLKVLPIKAGWKVKGVSVKMVTAAVGTTFAADIGITGGTADGFDAAISLKGAAGTVTQSTPSDTYPAAGGYYATAAGTIDVLCKTVTAVTTMPAFIVFAEIEDLT